MQKKIEYISKKLVKSEIEAFETEVISDLEAEIGRKYRPHLSGSLISAVANSAWACLHNSLYLTGSTFGQLKPSFRQQICAIHDYKNLLAERETSLRFFEKANYWSCYSTISLLLHEKNQFKETHTISEKFWRQIGNAHKENLPPEYYELYLDFVEEMTRTLTEAAITMVSTQIQNIFPGQSAMYRQSLEGVYGSSLDEHIVTSGEESSQLKTKKVKFSL